MRVIGTLYDTVMSLAVSLHGVEPEKRLNLLRRYLFLLYLMIDWCYETAIQAEYDPY